VQFPPNRVAS